MPRTVSLRQECRRACAILGITVSHINNFDREKTSRFLSIIGIRDGNVSDFVSQEFGLACSFNLNKGSPMTYNIDDITEEFISWRARSIEQLRVAGIGFTRQRKGNSAAPPSADIIRIGPYEVTPLGNLFLL